MPYGTQPQDAFLLDTCLSSRLLFVGRLPARRLPEERLLGRHLPARHLPARRSCLPEACLTDAYLLDDCRLFVANDTYPIITVK